MSSDHDVSLSLHHFLSSFSLRHQCPASPIYSNRTSYNTKEDAKGDARDNAKEDARTTRKKLPRTCEGRHRDNAKEDARTTRRKTRGTKYKVRFNFNYISLANPKTIASTPLS